MYSTMEFFNFSCSVMKREQEKFNINLTTAGELRSIDSNYDVVHKRCLYMYRYATTTFHFMNECLTKFFSEYQNTPDLILKWKLCTDLKLSSVSCGPALDYIALMSALSKYNFSVDSPFKSVKVISKYGAWRNTINIILDAINNGELSIVPSLQINKESIEVIQNDISSIFSQKLKDIFGDSDIIMMIKTFNLPSVLPDQESVIYSNLQELLVSMKPDSLLFVIDTKPAVDIFTRGVCRFPGTFLYGPSSENTKLPVTFDEFYVNTFGCLPVIHSRGMFFVWKKLSSFPLTKYVLPPTSTLSKGTEFPCDFCFNPVPVTCSEAATSKDILAGIHHVDEDVKTSKEKELIGCEGEMSENLMLPSKKSEEEVSENLMLPSKKSEEEVSENLMLPREKNQELKQNGTISSISQAKTDAVIHPNISCEIQCPENDNISLQMNIDNNGILKSPKSEESDTPTFEPLLQIKSPKCRRHRKKVQPAENENKVSLEPVLVDKFCQTYSESSKQEENHSGIKQLTNRITKLVTSFEGLAHKNELHGMTEAKTCVKNEPMIKENCNGYVPHSHANDACSHSCVNCHNHHFCNIPTSMDNFNRCHDQNGCHAYHCFHNTCIFQHMHYMCNNHCCLVPNRCEQYHAHHVPQYCCASYCSEPHSRKTNVSTTIPSLVIPLHNVSSDVKAQIISLLTQTSTKS